VQHLPQLRCSAILGIDYLSCFEEFDRDGTGTSIVLAVKSGFSESTWSTSDLSVALIGGTAAIIQEFTFCHHAQADKQTRNKDKQTRNKDTKSPFAGIPRESR